MSIYLLKQDLEGKQVLTLKESTPSHVCQLVRKITYIGVYGNGVNSLSYFLRTASLTVTFV
jgi:hypothetical protein